MEAPTSQASVPEVTKGERSAWFVSANPKIYDWENAFREGTVEWTGARSALAQINIRRCQPGDRVIAYRSSPDQLVVGLGHIEGAPTEYEEGGKRWAKVTIRMEPRPFAQPIPLSRIKEAAPRMQHFQVEYPSFTWVDPEDWAQLQPLFIEARRTVLGAEPLERQRPPRIRKSASFNAPIPSGEMIITTFDPDDTESWERLKRDNEVTWQFGATAKKGDYVLVYVPKGLTDRLGPQEQPGLRFLFRTAEDSHPPRSPSRWRQEARLIEKVELSVPVSLKTLRDDPVAGEWGPIRMNLRRIGEVVTPVPPPVRRAIWRLVHLTDPTVASTVFGNRKTTLKILPEPTMEAPDIASESPESAVSEPIDAPLRSGTGISETLPPPKSNAPPPPAPAQQTIPDDPEDGGYITGPAGYSSEFCGVGGRHPVPDHLGVDVLARRLAEQVTLRETKLPLAIGLFGHWGSGKSHFMNLMDRHMRQLALETPEDWVRRAAESGAPTRLSTPDEGPWCREIVPIYFNAWHYLDTNLWASLVSQIFESLFAHLRPKADDLAKVQRLLESASGATARAAEEVKLAEAATEQARKELVEAETKRLKKENAIEGWLQALKSFVPEGTPAELEEKAAALLGVQPALATVNDLRATVEKAKSLGRAQLLYNTVWKPAGRGWRVGWLLGRAAGAAALAVGAYYLPVIREHLQEIWRNVAGAVAGLGTLIALVRPFLERADRQLKELEGWAERVKTAQAAARETEEVRAARLEVADASAKEQAARDRLADSQAREKQLKEEALNLTPERRLGRFIEDRAQSADYRGQLGLVSLARRDFQELSNLFADREALREKVASLQATNEAAKLKEAEQITELSRSVDRIVLFVDDLDRCQPDKVVDVLQAVHLLLAYPLFAVVVGVDQRCLRQSLRIQFSGLLTPDKNGTDSRERPLADEAVERPATPLDYLEKIFHIPFHLPPMDEKGYKALIENLTQPEPPLPGTKPSAGVPGDRLANALPASSRPEHPVLGSPANVAPEVGVTPLPPGPDDAKAGEYPSEVVHPELVTPEEGDEPPLEETEAPLPIQSVRVVGSVPLDRWESEALKEYHSLIRTPRAAKRLLNTYRLVRAGIPEDDWDSFRGDEAAPGQYRLCMYLLALAAGHPAVVRDWFRLLRQMPVDFVLPAQPPVSHTAADWQLFKSSFQSAIAPFDPKPEKKTLVKWLDQVERFTF